MRTHCRCRACLQVRGADEGQTAFFECERCSNVWNIK